MENTIEREISSIKKFVRAADYLTTCQLFLQDNVLLDRPLIFDDIKPRLLGHWGTCPGINFMYAHLNAFIKKHNQSTMFILGPGHGFPALQANLFLEGTLTDYYPEAAQTALGIRYISKNFSYPGGFPSHTNPGTPGAIHEGGELGYALSTAYGAALDNPDLLVACVIGDGEAETGPTATAWHLNKLINPVTDGCVLPIVHLNGYKISGPTIYGRMSTRELKALFIGYGYEPLFVSGRNIDLKMLNALERARALFQKVREQTARGEKERTRKTARPPVIILNTPKGWTGIKYFNGRKIEGNCLSHQIPLLNAKTDKKELRALAKWLKSYKFEELFNPNTGFDPELLSIIPDKELRMGNNNHAYAGKIYKKLELPAAAEFAEDATVPGTIGSSSMRRAGLYLKAVCEKNRHHKNFRFFSPDETYSNKLDALFGCSPRSFMLPIEPWDKDLSPDGRVIEMLSEHTLQGLAQGYVLTGRHAVFASYEAFVEIVSSMASQYAKFLKVAQEYPWRQPCASLTYILTSSGWRQEHNGFSHQNPSFIGDLLQKYCSFVKAYFPPDGNSTLVTLKHCLAQANGINIIVAGKTVEPRWLTIESAERELEQELAIWGFASDPDPDIVFAGIGDYVTKEALAAVDLLKKQLPHAKIRFVNVAVLASSSACASNMLRTFADYFTADKPVIFNYHGYPETLKALLFDRHDTGRFSVYGYVENGSTTTPFDMHVCNRTDRYHLAIRALELLAERGVIAVEKSQELIEFYRHKLAEHAEYIKMHGVDPEEISAWQWSKVHDN